MCLSIERGVIHIGINKSLSAVWEAQKTAEWNFFTKKQSTGDPKKRDAIQKQFLRFDVRGKMSLKSPKSLSTRENKVNVKNESLKTRIENGRQQQF